MEEESEYTTSAAHWLFVNMDIYEEGQLMAVLVIVNRREEREEDVKLNYVLDSV